MKKINALLVLLLFSGAVWAQQTPYGDPDFDRDRDWRSGMPNVLRASAGDVNFQFDGSLAEIPFTLDGGPAEVFLAIYSKDANPQYGGAPFAAGGVGGAILRQAGLDTLISVSAGLVFSEGANSIAWNGLDYNGNPVPPGNYTYYLFALDNISNPTWVGPGPDPGAWAQTSLDISQDPAVIWSPRSDWTVKRGLIGTDYFVNPGAWESLDVSWIVERDGGSDPLDWRAITFYQVDPADPNVGFMSQTAFNDLTRLTGVWRVIYDPANGTLLPDESWSQADRGLVVWEPRLTGGTVKAAAHHPWVEDDGMLYVANTNRVSPMTPQVVVIDRATGEVASVLDMTDIYFHDYNGSIDTSGPWGIDVDERGVYTTGFWIQPDAFPAHVSLDGDLIWLNGNGDGFLDRYFGEEATARGLDPMKDQMVNVHVKAGKYNIAFLSGFNQPYWASVVGPDGHGLFNIELPKMSVGLGTHLWWVGNNSPIDGIYVAASGGVDLVHWPFDVASGTIGPTVTAVLELADERIPNSFALQDNYPNPFNASTTIRFSLPERGGMMPVTLTIYNTTGQLVSTLLARELGPGSYQISWDGVDDSGKAVASGVYLYRLHAGQEFVETRQMTLLK